jgi:hypothetical protein
LSPDRTPAANPQVNATFSKLGVVGELLKSRRDDASGQPMRERFGTFIGSDKAR